MRDNKFLKMDDSLITYKVSSFSAPTGSSGVVTCLVSPLELVDSEEEDEDFWGGEDEDCRGGEDGDFWGEEDREFLYPLSDFLPTAHLDWALMGDLCEGINATLEITPRKVKRVEGSF
jgi:hypothetical protein